MLVNQKNQVVKVSDKLNSKTHPAIFANLREKKEPSDKFLGKLYCIENRVHLK